MKHLELDFFNRLNSLKSDEVIGTRGSTIAIKGEHANRLLLFNANADANDGKALLAGLPLSLPLPFAFPFPLSPPLSARLLLRLLVPVGEVVTRRGPSHGNGGQRHWRGCQRAGGGVRRGNKGRRARSRHRLASDPAPSPPPCVMGIL